MLGGRGGCLNCIGSELEIGLRYEEMNNVHGADNTLGRGY